MFLLGFAYKRFEVFGERGGREEGRMGGELEGEEGWGIGGEGEEGWGIRGRGREEGWWMSLSLNLVYSHLFKNSIDLQE